MTRFVSIVSSTTKFIIKSSLIIISITRSFQNSGGGYSYSYSYSSSSSNSNSNWTTSSFNSSQCPSVTNGGPAAIQDFASSGNFEEDVLKAHNEYRALHGVPPLELSKDLCRYAMEWAKVR